MRARLVAAGLVAPLLAVVAAGAAGAHGAPLYPVSRAVVCGAEGSARTTAACRAARAGAGGAWFQQWDNVRVAGVAGRDRQKIPDGQLCSGGIDGFEGLDRARRDWPTTSIRAGARITVRYRTTIPHQGTFRVYLTRAGYDPGRALRWSDLDAKPFATVTDPPVASGAYRFTATLPAGRAGRHVVYTVWQNSSTPDTYYSCADVVLTSPARARAKAEPVAPAPTRARPRATATSAAARPSAVPTTPATTPATTGAAAPAPARAATVNSEPTSAIERARSLSGAAVAVAGLFGLLGFGLVAGYAGRRRAARRPRRH